MTLRAQHLRGTGSTADTAGQVLGYATVIVAVAIGILVVTWRLGSDDLHPDIYNSIRMVHLDLPQYIDKFYYSPVIEAQFWLCDRLFGGSMAGYRVPGATTGVLAILLLAFGLTTTWPGRHTAWAVVVVLFATNFHTQIYFRWGLATYGQNLLLSVVFLFAFLRLAQGRLSSTQRILLVPLLGVAPFIHFGLLIPIAAGALVALLIRLAYDVRSGQTERNVVLHQFSFLTALPIATITGWFVIRPWEWFASNRESGTYAPFNFPTSGFDQTLAGFYDFATTRAHALFADLIRVRTTIPPFEIADIRVAIDPMATDVILPLAAIGGFVSLVRWQQRERVFLVAYTALITFGSLLPSTWGLYRFGLPRYSMFLLAPTLALAGLGLSDLIGLPGNLIDVLRTTDRPRELPFRAMSRVAARSLALATIVWFAATYIPHLDEKRLRDRERYDKIIAAVVAESDSPTADLIVMGRTLGVWTGVLAPGVKERAEIIPDWQQNREPAPDPELTQEIRERLSSLNRVLIIGRVRIDEEHYPTLLSLFPTTEFERRRVACVYSRTCVTWLVRRQNPGSGQ